MVSYNNNHHRPVVRNGRLVYNNERFLLISKYNFSLYRFVCISVVLLLLWYTNPPNIPQQWIIKTTTKSKSSYRLLLSQYDTVFMSPTAIRNRRSLTNYGFVSVVEGYSELSVVGIGGYTLLTVQCNYGIQDSFQSRICERLRTLLCHEKSLSIIPSFLFNNKNSKKKKKNDRRSLSTYMDQFLSYVYDNSSNSNSNYNYNYSTNKTSKQLTIDDTPYLIHRWICWTMIILSLLTVCYYNRTGAFVFENNVWLDSIITLFVNPLQPIQSLVFNLLSCTLFVYPTFEKMFSIVLIQHPTSIFRLINDNTDIAKFYNYLFSILSLLLIAIGINALSKIWSNTYTCSLRFFALTAVSLGYYRGCITTTTTNVDTSSDTTTNYYNYYSYNDNNNNNNILALVPSFVQGSSSYLYNGGPTVIAITWCSVLLVYYTTHSVVATILYITANILGYSMGQYQYENIYLFVSINNAWDTVSNTIESIYTSIESFFLNTRQQHYVR